MIKKKTNKTKLIPFAMVAILPLSLSFGVSAFKLASAEDYSYISSYSQDVTSDNITNPSFADISSTYDNDEDGVVGSWSAIEEESGANGMIIDIGSGSSGSSNSSFSNYQNTVYFLESNPGASLGSDNKILMINSKTSSTTVNQQANKGFRSEEFTLSPNSYYSISFAVKTDTNGDSTVSASAYLSGIVDEDGNPLEIGYEFLSNSAWKNYQIFVATGDEEQTVTLDFYLGTNKNEYSTGVVFFDNVQMYQYSANEFISTARNNGYTADNYEDLDSTGTKFMVTTLLKEDNTLVDESFNFDFENDITSSDTLAPSWTVNPNHQNAHARIMRYDYPNTAFENESGYNYAGLDLSYDILNDKANENALVLWSNESGYITLQSKPIDINPHEIYKITASVKVVSADGAGFTLGAQEIGLNDDETQGIYAYHKNLNSSNYTLQSGQSTGITSNTTNNFTNNYQTVELYVKGHSLYKSSFAITLSFGSESSPSVGYVVVDNIKIENASYSDFSSASNQVTFSSYTTTNTNNSYFNETEAADENYPVTATGFTTEKANEDVNTSGVLYLYNKAMYDELYSSYEWYGIYPGSPQNSNQTNNVYMMYNHTNSHQSITSGSFSLSTEYQKVSFDLYTQSKFIANSASITVEIVDENGIVLFEESGIASEGVWNNFSVVFHSAENMSHTYTVKISLGTEDNEIAGYVYLDNVIASESTADEYNQAYYKNDFSDYYLSFENDKVTGDASTSTTTSAYTFEINEALDGGEVSSDYAVGAIVNGKENVYGIENDLNLLVLSTFKPSTATLTSVYSLSFESESYYKLTFDLQTMFPDAAKAEEDDEHECSYGVSVSINGFEVISNLTSEELQTFTIYLNSTSASTATLVFSITSDCHNTLGTAILTNIDLTSSTQAEFNNASNVQGYKETVFQSSYIQEEDDDESAGDEDTGSGDTPEPSTSPTSPWLLIGSIIMAVAMIVAIIAFFLRKIKFKKKDKIEKSKYDRKISIDQSLVANEAARRRDEELKNLFEAKESLKSEKTQLEEQHKNYVQEARINDKGKITKDTEKEFKSYAANMAKIEEKLAILEEQIAVVSAPEHLISLEKEVADEEEYRLKQEQKAIKDEIKTANSKSAKSEQPAEVKEQKSSSKKSAGKKSTKSEQPADAKEKKSSGKKTESKKADKNQK